MRKVCLSLLVITSLLNTRSFAQGAAKHKSKKSAVKSPAGDTPATRPHHDFFYPSGVSDGALFSTATMKRPDGYSGSLGTLRFSYVLNIGVNFNFDFCSHVGLFTGIDIKNMGFIEQKHDSTIKHRTYNLGVPLGLKIGNLNDQYLTLGGGIDFPINYREKEFTNRGHKEKFNEWFSDRTPAAMPYVFLGYTFTSGLTLKVQYYLNNYLNPDFSATTNGVSVKPYAGYEIHPILFSIGIRVPHSPVITGKSSDKTTKMVTRL